MTTTASCSAVFGKLALSVQVPVVIRSTTTSSCFVWDGDTVQTAGVLDDTFRPGRVDFASMLNGEPPRYV